MEIKCVEESLSFNTSQISRPALVVVYLLLFLSFQTSKCDVVLKYTDEEVRRLKFLGDLPQLDAVGEYDNNGLPTGNGDDGDFGGFDISISAI